MTYGFPDILVDSTEGVHESNWIHGSKHLRNTWMVYPVASAPRQSEMPWKSNLRRLMFDEPLCISLHSDSKLESECFFGRCVQPVLFQTFPATNGRWTVQLTVDASSSLKSCPRNDAERLALVEFRLLQLRPKKGEREAANHTYIKYVQTVQRAEPKHVRKYISAERSKKGSTYLAGVY